MLERRVWPAVVLALFCLPLYIGLGNRDLQGDEAGHSFSVDRILETGDWLIPKSSPSPDAPFLEKPPLKFWIVAGGIKAGLPLNEFGLRFWDVLFGGAAFLYVLGIGRRLGGPVCGALAVMILFVHGPLVTIHGLRANDMEAALVLAYCGGVFHYLRWTESDEDPRRRAFHAVAVGLYFALGFMVKFVAAAFLPMVLGLATILVGSYRTRFVRDWRLWFGSSVVSLALIAPWFIYCTVKFGRGFWDVIFGAHVYTRLTSYLNPDHVHPWNFYFTEIQRSLQSSNTWWLVLVGAALLIVDSIRLRKAAGLVVILWYVVPLTIISMTTSKLYHYAYPFLPAVALAGGYVGAFLWNAVRPGIEGVMQTAGRLAAAARNPVVSAMRHPALKGVFLTLAALSLTVMVWTVLEGRVTLKYGDVMLFRNTSLVRPTLVGAVMTMLAGWPEAIGRFGIPVLIVAIAPVDAYRATLQGLGTGRPVIRQTRDCILETGSGPALMSSGPRGLYVDGDGPVDGYDTPFNHEYAYYFRKVRPWMRPHDVSPTLLQRYLFDPAEQRPLLMSETRYHAVLNDFPPDGDLSRSALPALVSFEEDVVMVLPGPYAACGSGSASDAAR
jgi:4-amino-4-deoxy-L-arabinose transferase-like glycosyltransferase